MKNTVKRILAVMIPAVLACVMFTGCAPAAGAEGEGGGAMSFIMLALIVVVFYFFMIRPENKRKKKIAEMRNNLGVGDQITTIGGIVGKIVALNDEFITIETGEDRVRIQLAKWSVSTTGKDSSEQGR